MRKEKQSVRCTEPAGAVRGFASLTFQGPCLLTTTVG